MRLKLQIKAVGLWMIMVLMLGAAGSVAAAEAGLEELPDVLISAASEASQDFAIIVEKNTQNLYLYRFGQTSRVVFRIPCSTGEAGGAKSRAGDKKTPEGIYFFTKEHPQRDLAPIYGSRAFPMDYPNLMDRISERDGNSIWMHGTNKPLKPRDSNGCVALENGAIDKLAEYIRLNRTPIIIVDKMGYMPAAAAAEDQKLIGAFLLRWKEALENGSYHDYLMFYDNTYLPDISWWPVWLKLKNMQAPPALPLQVDLKNVMLLKYREVFIALFDQVVKTADEELPAGTRKLFLAHRDNRLHIVGDVYQVLPEAAGKDPKTSDPLVAAGLALGRPAKVKTAAVRKEEKTSANDREIQDMVHEWLKAWSSGDIAAYGSFYAANFRSQGGANRQAWLDYKSRINRRYAYINVTGRNLVVKKQKNRWSVTFIQNYESSGLKTAGTKQLVVVREDGQWKIYQEIYQNK